MTATKEITIEARLKALYQLQQIDSKVDQIQHLKGELPLEVKDLEDELEGLKNRQQKVQEEIKEAEQRIVERRQAIKDGETAITKYNQQLNAVKNNREFEALNKEIEINKLDIQLSEKKIREANEEIHLKNQLLKESEGLIEGKKKDLNVKAKELEKIIAETEKEEKALAKLSEKAQKDIEDRLLVAYNRIRKNYRNGLAVVKVDRNSCGGCYNKIPPQLQSEISQRKKLIICEHCGRILVDPNIDGEEQIVE